MGAPIAIPTVTGQIRRFWTFYRRYTDTTVHTAATAALTIFGLLVFVDPWFAVVAIGCYVVPPVVIYALAGSPVGEPALEDRTPTPPDRPAERATPVPEPERSNGGDRSRPRSNVRAAADNGDSDSDADDGDTDSDSDGTDTDADSDSDDGDTDSDSDS